MGQDTGLMTIISDIGGSNGKECHVETDPKDLLVINLSSLCNAFIHLFVSHPIHIQNYLLP